MKLLVTCVHLVRHINNYFCKLKAAGIECKTLYPNNQQFNSFEMLKVLPGNNFIIAGDDEITENVIKLSASKGLKAIVKWGIGVDNIDIDASKKYNIPVFNTPNAFGADVAEQAISLILNLTRGTHIIDSEVRKGNWLKIEGTSLIDKTIGIIGLGSIGKEIALRAASFGMKITFYDPFVKNDLNTKKYSNLSFDELCAQSDFIVLACSLNEENSNIINKDSISKMIKKPYIINISRGPLINEKDLITALNEEKIKGAGLDVFEKEPLPITSDLINKKNCILGSHNSSNTLEAVNRVNNITVEMILDFTVNGTKDSWISNRII